MADSCSICTQKVSFGADKNTKVVSIVDIDLLLIDWLCSGVSNVHSLCQVGKWPWSEAHVYTLFTNNWPISQFNNDDNENLALLTCDSFNWAIWNQVLSLQISSWIISNQRFCCQSGCVIQQKETSNFSPRLNGAKFELATNLWCRTFVFSELLWNFGTCKCWIRVKEILFCVPYPHAIGWMSHELVSSGWVWPVSPLSQEAVKASTSPRDGERKASLAPKMSKVEKAPDLVLTWTSTDETFDQIFMGIYGFLRMLNLNMPAN